MIEFIVFAFYILISSVLLIIVPVMMLPGMPIKRKLLICGIGFLIFVPFSLLLYSWLGTPQLANS
ncbi:MAG: hypothetical protein K2X09_00360 [Rickettsiales bacterium]|nr:hypothetical protein [Rickettsiales bacterium]